MLAAVGTNKRRAHSDVDPGFVPPEIVNAADILVVILADFQSIFNNALQQQVDNTIRDRDVGELVPIRK